MLFYVCQYILYIIFFLFISFILLQASILRFKAVYNNRAVFLPPH
nr:MAG TPA: Potassium-transporting ATPase alpha chain 1-type ATPase, proton pump, gastric [Caudoviricetes sp.]